MRMSPSVISTIRLAIRIAVVLPQPGGADQDADLARRHLEAELVDRGAVGPGIDLGHLAELDRERVLGAFAAGARARLHVAAIVPAADGNTLARR